MIKILLVSLFLITNVYASATRSIDADTILSSDHTKTFTVPANGQIPIAAQFLRDAFSGNGSTTGFTLSFAPGTTASVQVFQDGLLLTQTDDYTISGTTLTMITAPVLGQKLLVIYSRY